MIQTSTGGDALALEIERRRVANEAARQLTSGTLRTGWSIVIAGYCLGVVPIVGLFLMVFTGLAGAIFGILAVIKGNPGGGFKLMAGAWFGTGLVAMVWMGIYTAVVAVLS